MWTQLEPFAVHQSNLETFINTTESFLMNDISPWNETWDNEAEIKLKNVALFIFEKDKRKNFCISYALYSQTYAHSQDPYIYAVPAR